MNGIKKTWNELNPVGVQLLVSLIIGVWGLWVFLPWWNVFDTSLTYRAMQGLATESEWGGGMVLLAITSGYAVNTDAPGSRLLAAFATSCLMTFMSLLFAISAFQGTGWVLWLSLAAFNWKGFQLQQRKAREQQQGDSP